MHNPSATDMLRARLALSLETPEVKLGHTDGRWRVYRHECGMHLLAAFTRDGHGDIDRTLYGLRFRGIEHPVLYADPDEAQRVAHGLNARLG